MKQNKNVSYYTITNKIVEFIALYMRNLERLAESILGKKANSELEPIDKKSINSVYRDAEGNYVKKFRGVPFEAINNYFSGRSIHLETSLRRKEKELSATEHLEDADFKVPQTKEQDSRTLVKDPAPGRDFSDYLEKEPLDNVYDAAREFGARLRALHDAGNAFQDPAPRNFKIEITEDEDYNFWAFDSEFFLEGSDEDSKEYDLRCIDKKAKTMERERYLTTMLGLEEGYGTDKESTKSSMHAMPPLGSLSNYIFNTTAERFSG